MASLASMPPIQIDQEQLAKFGQQWIANGERLSRSPPYSSLELGRLFDLAVGQSLATMLGSIPIESPNANALIPAQADCVEVGPVRVVGGVRPQNFDVGYRPDGIRFAFDSKTLNDRESVGKNWQNMVNDPATEATTIHSRFPQALVVFMVICPAPCLAETHQKAMVETLERLNLRSLRPGISDHAHLAEAISLVVWQPDNGTISTEVPGESSSLRIERFSTFVETIYISRYKGLPPHTE